MVLAYHLIFTAYGFWLPNDPRGSWSDFVRSFDLYRAAGPATKTTSHRSLANRPHNSHIRIAAKSALAHDPVHFTEPQRLAIAEGFAHAVTRSNFMIHACSILPDHIHAVIARHSYNIEQVMNQLKGEASKSLTRQNLHPFQNTFVRPNKRHSPWADDGWDVYLDTPDDIHRATAYVEKNPTKEGLPSQHWSFTRPYPATQPL